MLDAHDAIKAVMNEYGNFSLTIYGEGYGAGIQSGGKYREDKGFIGFDVFVKTHAEDRGLWLSDDDVTNILRDADIPRVPVLGEMTIEEAVLAVRIGQESSCSTEPQQAEGIILRTREPLYDNRGSRLITKIKHVDFAPASPKPENVR